MEFTNPWGFISFIAVPALVALYILKQKHREMKIPSLFLWQKTASLMEASTPWQKLRRNLLFILQLAAVSLICFMICGPALTDGRAYGEITAVIDASASMRAVDSDPGTGGKTRFERALDDVMDVAGRLSRGQKMSVLIAGDAVLPAVSHSDDRAEIKKALRDCACGYSGGSLSDALTLAEGMTEGSDGGSLTIVYTDYDPQFSGFSGRIEVVNLAGTGTNTAVTHMSCGGDASGFTVMSTVRTFGPDAEYTLELRCDGLLTDAKKVSLKKGEAQSVYWTGISPDRRVASVTVVCDDILSDDNTVSIPLERTEERRVLAVSDNAFFIEKVFSSIGGYTFYKSGTADFDASLAEGYDLYIFDCFVPSKLPEGGSVWFISPDTDTEGLDVKSYIKGTTLSSAGTAASSEIGAYVNFSEIALSGFYEISCGDGWETVALCGMLPAMAVKSAGDGRKFAMLAFDIHNSNLPLLKEFPILVQNLLSYSLPAMTDGAGLRVAGSVISVNSLAYSKSVSAEAPDGTVTELAPPFPAVSYRLAMPGVYTLKQQLSRPSSDGSTEAVGYISAAIPEDESGMSGEIVENRGGARTKTDFRGQRELWPFILAAVLVLLAAEWWVYCREY